MKFKKEHTLVYIIALVSLALQCIYLWGSSLDRLTAISFVDDSFYYLNIARHIATDGICSFDGLHRTNGFQPLWQALILPLGFVRSPEWAVRLLGLAGAVLYQAVTVALYAYLKPITSRRVALTAAVLWAFNARFAFTYALSGMEFSLYALTVLWVLLAWAHYARSGRGAAAFGLGVAAGFCLLARFDGLLLAGLAGCALLWLGFRSGRRACALRHALLYGGGIILTALPYYTWNLASFGHLTPVSGSIKLHATTSLLASGGVPYWGVRHLGVSAKFFGQFLVKDFLRFATGYFYYLFRLARLSQNVAGGVGLTLSLGWSLWYLKRRPAGEGRGLAQLGLLFVFVPAQFAAYALLLFPYLNYGNWYFAPFYLACTILAAWAIGGTLGGSHGRRITVVGLTILALNTATFLLAHDETKINVTGARECLAYLEKNVRGERIGSWNAGYLGYFSKNNTVVNLDGLVNDYELAAIHRQGKPIRDYLKRNNIRIICDYLENPGYLDGGFYGLQPAQYRVLYKTRLYQPEYIESRIYYVLELLP